MDAKFNRYNWLTHFLYGRDPEMTTLSGERIRIDYKSTLIQQNLEGLIQQSLLKSSLIPPLG